MKLYKSDDYHEDYGDCIFFHFENFEEYPDIRIGSPLDDRWKNDCWTHFIRFDFNDILDQAKALV